MSTLRRTNPDNPCQPNGAHHPHRWMCDDPDDCDCWGEWNEGRGLEPYNLLICCVDGEEWPCASKLMHITARRKHGATHFSSPIVFFPDTIKKT